MRADRWAEIDRLIQSALDRPKEERNEFLESACSDAVLRDEVRSLLVRYENDTSDTELISASSHSSGAARPTSEYGELSPGRQISKYQILSKLGHGGMGDVYLAQDVTLGRKVALKILMPGLNDLLATERSVFAEARAASSLNHVNIMTVFDAGEAEGRQFIATEYVEGVTLRERIKAGAIPLTEALHIAVQVACALGAAHEAGVVHRDIKPENIMTRRDGVVKVLDFGIAKFRDSLLEAGSPKPDSVETITASQEMVLGSLPYMSPEQARGKHVDSRSDIFSFGALLFELFSGKPAFSGGSNISTLIAVVNHRPVLERDPNMPRALQRIVDSCLQKDPKDRPDSIEEVRTELEGLLARLVSQRARKRRIAAIVAAVLVVVAGILLWIWQRPAKQQSFVQKRLTHEGAYIDPVIGLSGSSIFFDKVDNWTRSTLRISMDGKTSFTMDFAGIGPDHSFEVQDGSPALDEVLFRHSQPSGTGAAVFSLLHFPEGTRLDIPNVSGFSGALSPDGSEIAYYAPEPSSNSGAASTWALLVADKNGKVVRRWAIAQLPKPATREIAWSRDGSLWFMQNERLFEVSRGDAGPHPVFSSEKTPQGPGKWTANGERFIFSDVWSQDIYALSRKREISAGELSRLTSGPLQFGPPVPGADGQNIYAVGTLKRGRVTRYDRASHQWLPYLDGISVDGVDCSPDGKRVTYVTYPEGEIWINDLDAIGREQVTHEPMRALAPRFSPDSRQITFMGRLPGEAWHVYLYEGGGKPARKLVTPIDSEATPNWSPDGSTLIYSPLPWDVPVAQRRLYTYDVRSGVTAAVRGSEGLFSPRWAPNKKWIAALRYRQFGPNPLVLLDMASGQVTELSINGLGPSWSRDSRFIYLLNKTPLNPPIILKVSVADKSVQTVVRYLSRTTANSPVPGSESIWLGFTLDESPLLLQDLGNREIYEIAPEE